MYRDILKRIGMLEVITFISYLLYIRNLDLHPKVINYQSSLQNKGDPKERQPTWGVRIHQMQAAFFKSTVHRIAENINSIQCEIVNVSYI